MDMGSLGVLHSSSLSLLMSFHLTPPILSLSVLLPQRVFQRQGLSKMYPSTGKVCYPKCTKPSEVTNYTATGLSVIRYIYGSWFVRECLHVPAKEHRHPPAYAYPPAKECPITLEHPPVKVYPPANECPPAKDCPPPLLAQFPVQCQGSLEYVPQDDTECTYTCTCWFKYAKVVNTVP